MSAVVQRKADRLLVEGRVRLLRVGGDVVLAAVEGDTGSYSVSSSGGSWTCDCPARVECSHRVAVQRVVAPRPLPPTRRQLADARAHEIRLGHRGDDPPSRPPAVPPLTVGSPPRVVLDDCPLCGAYGPTTLSGICGACASVDEA